MRPTRSTGIRGAQEALAAARAQDKPILLSIGYSACHWCHVMAHESFEDPAVAALMNELFINIKVDREERPDLDQIYQAAHALLTRRNGGWPLTDVPDARPDAFFRRHVFSKNGRATACRALSTCCRKSPRRTATSVRRHRAAKRSHSRRRLRAYAAARPRRPRALSAHAARRRAARAREYFRSRPTAAFGTAPEVSAPRPSSTSACAAPPT